ncbi:Protein kinase-like domain [Pseudocohnilembus persalinus]|uniref:Protein kinase-like domain n=1 Tax=Pseudocohnilembus persalinus TaxID=266149 RepID=A0A0V0QTC2_PSEPJ|nr:Protein kinase-like domain [Pseudocohnilembus persalinus]|eukprot:KRX05554.1 Protein kinase-like domain [Pseudocohnilembus persalinus]
MEEESVQQPQIIFNNQTGVVIFGIDDSKILKLSQHCVDDENKCTENCQRLLTENFYQSKLNSDFVLPHFNEVQVNKIYEDEHFIYSQGCYVIMERAESDLQDQIFQEKKLSTLQEVRNAAKQICNAVKNVHDQGLSHNDIKSDNFFYYSVSENWEIEEEQFVIKIGDFGYTSEGKMTDFDQFVSLFQNKNEDLLSCEILEALQTDYYALVTPEINFDLQKLDIYNLGYLLFELVYQEDMQYLFEKRNLKQFLDNEKGQFTSNLKQGLFYNIIKSCLNEKPQKRPTIDEIIEQLTKL